MYDFKPFWLADNMARSPNLDDFRNREGARGSGTEIDAKKPGRVSVAGLFLGFKGSIRVTSGEISSPGRNYFALATIDSNGL
jgi:hypothetical protein